MSTHSRRLERLESALTPLEAVLVWLEEAHEHPSLDAYARSIMHLDAAEAPLSRILARVEAAARDRHRGEREDIVASRLRTAIGDAAFLFELALVIEVTASRFASDHLIRVMFVSHLLGEALDRWLLDRPSTPADIHGLHGLTIERMRPEVAAVLERVPIERSARDLLTDGYLGGRSPLFDESAAAWARLEHETEAAAAHLAWAHEIRPPDGSSAGDGRPAGPDAMTRAREMADEARIGAHRLLGDEEAARRIATVMLTR